ncbi:hypothetical protein HMPREF1586_00703 [Gardnerella vaginalis JCP8522]|nr:hypothetical protein HMPREF1586_00703 [Gardnerella vaginalis JCP8522]
MCAEKSQATVRQKPKVKCTKSKQNQNRIQTPQNRNINLQII